MPETPDLSFVPPDKHDLVRRRIASIERFLAAPGRKAAESGAAEVGLKVAQFYNLARAWRELGRPEALAGAGAPRQNRQPSIGPDMAEAIDAVIVANARLAPTKLVNKVVERLKAEGKVPPSRDALNRYVYRARPALLTGDDRTGPELAVDHAVLDLPVRFENGSVSRPLGTFVVDTRTEEVVGLVLSDGVPAPEPTASALLFALRNGVRRTSEPERDPIRIAIPTDPDQDWSELDAALGRAGVNVQHQTITPHTSGRLITSIVGLVGNGIALRPRLVWIYLDKRSRTPSPPKPLTVSEALEFARARLISSATNTSFTMLDPLKRRALQSELAGIAAGPSAP